MEQTAASLLWTCFYIAPVYTQGPQTRRLLCSTETLRMLEIALRYINQVWPWLADISIRPVKLSKISMYRILLRTFFYGFKTDAFIKHEVKINDTRLDYCHAAAGLLLGSSGNNIHSWCLCYENLVRFDKINVEDLVNHTKGENRPMEIELQVRFTCWGLWKLLDTDLASNTAQDINYIYIYTHIYIYIIYIYIYIHIYI